MLPAEQEIYEAEFVPESSAGGCKLLVSQSRAPTDLLPPAREPKNPNGDPSGSISTPSTQLIAPGIAQWARTKSCPCICGNTFLLLGMG